MYNYEKRSRFETLGELRVLLADFPDSTPVYVCGVANSYLHVDEDEGTVTFDDESLYYCYPEDEGDD